jgi:hypothetical protein
VSWGGRGVPWEETIRRAWHGIISGRVEAHGRTQTARFGYLNLTLLIEMELTPHVDHWPGTGHVTNDPIGSGACT